MESTDQPNQAISLWDFLNLLSGTTPLGLAVMEGFKHGWTGTLIGLGIGLAMGISSLFAVHVIGGRICDYMIRTKTDGTFFINLALSLVYLSVVVWMFIASAIGIYAVDTLLRIGI